MNLTTHKLMTLEEYLNYADETEESYELVDGELVQMPPESDRNYLITIFLLSEFLKLIPFHLIRTKTEVVVSGRRARVRVPDLIVLTEELFEVLKDAKRSTITVDMPPPALVVEVVSPGKTNEDRDYRYKRSEYAARGIAEYWIVDPLKAQVMVLTLIDGLYEERVFNGSDSIESTQFPQLQLTAAQVLQTAT